MPYTEIMIQKIKILKLLLAISGITFLEICGLLNQEENLLHEKEM